MTGIIWSSAAESSVISISRMGGRSFVPETPVIFLILLRSLFFVVFGMGRV
jgi:hypothetical protein